MRTCRGCGVEERDSALRLCPMCASLIDLETLRQLCEAVWPVEHWPTGPGRVFRMTLRWTRDGSRIVKVKKASKTLAIQAT